MISDNLKSSYNNYLKTAKIEELESLSAFYSNTDPISAESTIIFFDFLRHFVGMIPRLGKKQKAGQKIKYNKIVL